MNPPAQESIPLVATSSNFSAAKPVEPISQAISKSDSEQYSSVVFDQNSKYDAKKLPELKKLVQNEKHLILLARSTEQKETEALIEFALCELNGYFAKSNPSEAFRLLKIAADEKKHQLAQCMLGDLYKKNIGISEKIPERYRLEIAFTYYETSFKNQNKTAEAESAYAIALAYYDHIGIPSSVSVAECEKRYQCFLEYAGKCGSKPATILLQIQAELVAEKKAAMEKAKTEIETFVGAGSGSGFSSTSSGLKSSNEDTPRTMLFSTKSQVGKRKSPEPPARTFAPEYTSRTLASSNKSQRIM